MAIRRATDADFRNLCVTAMRAFHDDPVMRWLYRTDEEYFEPNGLVFESAMTNWLAHRELWCTDDGAALAVWFAPADADTPEPEWIDVGPPPPPERVPRFELLGSAMAANKPPEPHWYLQLLATHPDWQRQGLGAQLMDVVFTQADAEGIACYLETERPELVAYYRHHGFEVRSEWDIDPDATLGEVGPHMWGMLRGHALTCPSEIGVAFSGSQVAPAPSEAPLPDGGFVRSGVRRERRGRVRGDR